MGNKIYSCFGKQRGVLVLDNTNNMSNKILEKDGKLELFSENEFEKIPNPKSQDLDWNEV